MIPTDIIAFYAKLPKQFIKGDVTISEEAQQKLEEKVEKALDKKLTIFVQGNPLPLYQALVKSIDPLQIHGEDFAKLFDAQIKSEAQPLTRKGKVIFLYNVGLEKAVNKEFAIQFLNSIIASLKINYDWVVIVSELSHSDFKRMYRQDVKNNLRFPSPKEEKIF